ncbi:MAG: ATP-binding protein, partial [Anaerolineales bacterium]|nr:ATP-binding protein [Anaerolineales bacterium]
VDADMLGRVLANLIDNALKHLLEHGVLTIEVQPFDTFYQISVMDNGVGIEPEDRDRIFLPYAQLADERKRGRGFGLGLAFVSRAVAAHNGRVWVESGDDGVGSKFVFTLPA